jgi:hypothetical protein
MADLDILTGQPCWNWTTGPTVLDWGTGQPETPVWETGPAQFGWGTGQPGLWWTTGPVIVG